jgi:hypothetical protein
LQPEVTPDRDRFPEGQEMPLSGTALLELLQAVLARGAPFRFRAKGPSMFPFIRDGDVVTVAPLKGIRLRRGDVVACVPPRRDTLVIHRVVARRGQSYLVKGDATSEADGLVQEADILGRVMSVERRGSEVRLGFGLERQLIAMLARSGLFVRVIFPLARWVRSVLEKVGL